eukprot:Rhum_TRINITY_DN2176_c0_g1::Rhum_TRINITY_DN2176_c0_g1_i1::g.6182::m.6182
MTLAVGSAVRVGAISDVKPVGDAEGWWCDGMSVSCGQVGVVEEVFGERAKVQFLAGHARPCFWWYSLAVLTHEALEDDASSVDAFVDALCAESTAESCSGDSADRWLRGEGCERRDTPTSSVCTDEDIDLYLTILEEADDDDDEPSAVENGSEGEDCDNDGEVGAEEAPPKETPGGADKAARVVLCEHEWQWSRPQETSAPGEKPVVVEEVKKPKPPPPPPQLAATAVAAVPVAGDDVNWHFPPDPLVGLVQVRV